MAGSVDVLQFDVSRCPGITQWLRVAAVAAVHGLHLGPLHPSLHLNPACSVAEHPPSRVVRRPGRDRFTVSLFITGLAFTSEELQMQAKIGILAGSVIAAIVGVAILLRQSEPAEDEAVSTADAAAV